MDKNKNINFRLLGINTEEFATIEIGNISEAYELLSDLQFFINPENRLVSCKMKFQFLDNKQPFIILTVVCNFDIEENSWNTNVFSNKKITLPKHFLEHICVITVGTSRGVLHAKTENTIFNKFVIPTLNITHLVQNDVVFEIK